MEQSLYFKYIEKYFPKLVLGITEKLNEENQTTLSYLHKQLLGTDYSVDGRWESLTGTYSRVAADVVSMDSSLPLKKRDSLGRASGDLPKIGMELFLNEKQMSDIDALIAQNANIDTIVAKIFADTPRVIIGVLERLEYMFLQGLSTGVALVDSDNVGAGVKVDYQYLTENQFGVQVLWNTPATAKPLDDIQRVVDRAESLGYNIRNMYADTYAINKFLACDQVRQQYAFVIGYVGALNNVPIPSLEQANVLLNDKFGLTLTKVNRSVVTEVNGVRTPVKPWQEGMVVFTVEDRVGSVVWTDLAEKKHPVAGVSYETANEFILVSKYRVNRPSLREYTTSQARVVPVITNVDKIFTLDSKTVQA